MPDFDIFKTTDEMISITNYTRDLLNSTNGVNAGLVNVMIPPDKKAYQIRLLLLHHVK